MTAGQSPLETDGQHVWVWFGVDPPMPDTILMVLIADPDADGMPSYRMLIALDEETASAMAVHAGNAARELGLLAECREFQITRVVDRIDPHDSQEG